MSTRGIIISRAEGDTTEENPVGLSVLGLVVQKRCWINSRFYCFLTSVIDTTRGGWCSSCGPAESSKLFASVPRATRPGDSRFQPNSNSLVSAVHVDDDGNACRWTYIEFYSRYSILMSQQEADLSDKKQTCKNVLQRVIQVRLFHRWTGRHSPFFTLMHLSCGFTFIGPQPIQVWPHKDLFPRGPGRVSGEAASGPAQESLRDHPETRPGVEPEEEVPPPEGGRHHSAGVHPRKEDNPVRSRPRSLTKRWENSNY